MRHEKALDPAKVHVTVVGAEERFACRPERQATYLTASFQPKSHGCYTVMAEYDLGISDFPHDPGAKYYIQYANTVIPMSHSMGDYRPNPEQPLEIVPVSCRRFSPGKIAELLVFYEGVPLSGKGETVSCACSKIDTPFELSPDSSGKVEFELVSGGNWMFMVRYNDRGKGLPGLYSERAMTATYTIIGV